MNDMHATLSRPVTGGFEAVRLPPTHGASGVPPERVTRGG